MEDPVSNALSKLKALSRGSISQDQFRAIIDEINGADDRSAVIVWAAMLEQSLRVSLMQKMPDLSPIKADKIFEGDGVLSTFSSKIVLADALKVINNVEARNLERIKAIRNAFAHRPNITLYTKEVENVCVLLQETIVEFTYMTTEEVQSANYDAGDSFSIACAILHHRLTPIFPLLPLPGIRSSRERSTKPQPPENPPGD